MAGSGPAERAGRQCGPGGTEMAGKGDPLDVPTRVVKTMAAGEHGTLRWLREHGARLVCVRYRHDPLRIYRFTTIELVVQESPIRPAMFKAAHFGIEVSDDEDGLRSRLKRSRRARWDPVDGLWWVRGDLILEAGLLGRVRVR